MEYTFSLVALAVAHSFPYGTIEFIAHRRLLTVNDYRSRFIRLTNRQHFHSDFIIHIRISRSLWSLALISIAINFMDFIVHFYFFSLSLSVTLSHFVSLFNKMNQKQHRKIPISNSIFIFFLLVRSLGGSGQAHGYVWCHLNCLTVT